MKKLSAPGPAVNPARFLAPARFATPAGVSAPSLMLALALALTLLLASACKQSAPADSKAVVSGNVTITVDFGPIKPRAEFQQIPAGGLSLWDAMNAAKNQGLTFTFAESRAGRFITGINDVSQNVQQKTFWLYCLNRSLAPSGVNQTILKAGDQIDWYLTPKTNPCPAAPNRS